MANEPLTLAMLEDCWRILEERSQRHLEGQRRQAESVNALERTHDIAKLPAWARDVLEMGISQGGPVVLGYRQAKLFEAELEKVRRA